MIEDEKEPYIPERDSDDEGGEFISKRESLFDFAGIFALACIITAFIAFVFYIAG